MKFDLHYKVIKQEEREERQPFCAQPCLQFEASFGGLWDGSYDHRDRSARRELNIMFEISSGVHNITSVC